MKITTYDPKKRKVVLAGNIEGLTFHKTVNSKHFMRILQGYGIQEVVIQQLIEKQIKYIILKTSTGKLRSKLSDWLALNIKVMDFGNGKQRFLPISYMEKKTI